MSWYTKYASNFFVDRVKVVSYMPSIGEMTLAIIDEGGTSKRYCYKGDIAYAYDQIITWQRSKHPGIKKSNSIKMQKLITGLERFRIDCATRKPVKETIPQQTQPKKPIEKTLFD